MNQSGDNVTLEVLPGGRPPVAPKSLIEALVGAQTELKNVLTTKTNPHFKSRYADLASVRDAVTPILTKYGLAVAQLGDIVNGAFILRTRLMHVSGQCLESIYPLPTLLDTPQKMGSAVTYARRYSLAAILGIASEEDDDAEAIERTNRRSAHADAMIQEIRNCKAAAALETWWSSSATKAVLLRLDEAEQDRVRNAYSDRLHELKKT